MHTFALPNGLRVFAPSEFEAFTLYREIYAMRTYLSHGVTVSDGDCVFDIGANIGLFSIYLGQMYRGLKLFAFEPIRETYSLFEQNVKLHLSDRADLQMNLFNYGVSNRRGTAQFEYDRFMSLGATMHSKEVIGCVRKDAGTFDWLNASVLDLERISKISPKQARMLLKALSNPITGVVVAAPIIAFLKAMGYRKKVFLKRMECELRTVSEVMREHKIDAVDLMKIDVEGSEMDVLRGVEPEDWPKIKQFVVEVHNVDGRVASMKSLFESHGYRTIVDQEDWALHKLINIFTIYAVQR